jgi:hypothetical protein
VPVCPLAVRPNPGLVRTILNTPIELTLKLLALAELAQPKMRIMEHNSVTRERGGFRVIEILLIKNLRAPDWHRRQGEKDRDYSYQSGTECF